MIVCAHRSVLALTETRPNAYKTLHTHTDSYMDLVCGAFGCNDR